MGLLDPYIAQYHAEVKPQIMDAAHSARWYAEQMLHRLTCIHREMAIDRDPGETMAVNLVLPGDASYVPVFLVPAGEEYVLEAFSLAGGANFDAAASGRLYSDRQFRLFYGNPGIATSGIRFMGPCQIEANVTVQAGGLPVVCYVQLRRLARRARPTQSGGRVETGLDAVDALREHDPLHSGIGVG